MWKNWLCSCVPYYSTCANGEEPTDDGCPALEVCCKDVDPFADPDDYYYDFGVETVGWNLYVPQVENKAHSSV